VDSYNAHMLVSLHDMVVRLFFSEICWPQDQNPAIKLLKTNGILQGTSNITISRLCAQPQRFQYPFLHPIVVLLYIQEPRFRNTQYIYITENVESNSEFDSALPIIIYVLCVTEYWFPYISKIPVCPYTILTFKIMGRVKVLSNAFFTILIPPCSVTLSVR
jgi:hypothetical protein